MLEQNYENVDDSGGIVKYENVGKNQSGTQESYVRIKLRNKSTADADPTSTGLNVPNRTRTKCRAWVKAVVIVGLVIGTIAIIVTTCLLLLKTKKPGNIFIL